jgi:hypothetical protein
MGRFGIFVRLALAGLPVWPAALPAPTAAAQFDQLPAILNALADRTQQYYDRFVSIICTESVQQQELKSNLAPTGKPRVTVFELSVSRSTDEGRESDFRVERALQSVNGRQARPNQQPGCTDPKTGTPEPLAFLLKANQADYHFKSIDESSGALDPARRGPPGTRTLEFTEREVGRPRISWKGNCFNADGAGHAGTLWYDPATYDVRQVTIRLAKPFQVPVPSASFGLQPPIRVERWETTLRFARVKFSQPDESALLPQSIETLTVFRGAPSFRTRQELSNYRRFLAEASIRTSTF